MEPGCAQSEKTPELADVISLYGKRYQKQYHPSFFQRKVMNAILRCRTAFLGGHIKRCDTCGYESIFYNSCRNRHCPKCQTMRKEKWLNGRRAELVPVGYFHLVFTIPHLLNPLILCNKSVMLSVFFICVNETLQAFASDPKWRLNGQLGFIAVLHTWSQTLLDHFHLHCLIPAGALSPDKKRWIPTRRTYLFGIQSLAKAFRNRYLKKVQELYEQGKLTFPGETQSLGTPHGFAHLIRRLKAISWIAYAKRPFAGPEQVLEYLGRYTHRVAISNERIKSVDNDRVTFTYKDRSDDNKKKIMSLHALEFIRRFLLHVLPNGFVKIRYYGFLSHRIKNENIGIIRKLIDPLAPFLTMVKETIQEIMLRVTGIDITRCPLCKKGTMIRWATLLRVPSFPRFHQEIVYDSS